MKRRHLMLLPILALTASCARVGDPLGSSALKERDPGREYTPDLTVHAGFICRVLSGQAGVGDIQGAGIGARCQQIGEEPMSGCMRWEQPGISFESPGCVPAPTISPALAVRLDEVMGRIEAIEIDAQEIRDDLIEDYGPEK